MIEILDEETVNKIAAGEVIERPASALKELLENAADSGASRIEVDFEAGGKTEIRVLDDGCGMTLDELPLSLTRFATSKIRKIDDLMSLSTFGFRGEALASLAAVSELTMHSGKPQAAMGAKITSRGGKLEGPEPASPLAGTQVVVKNLFFNVPARQKFLKSDAGETTAIKKTVKAFALSHPELTVVLRQSGKALYHWPKQDFLKRACQVLEIDSKNTVSIELEEGGIRLQAVCALPEFNISTQQGIWIFVQNRPVTDRTILQAIFEGYRNLLMQQQYPQIVLSLTVPPQEVDVNVHPTKAQVKFAQPSLIFKTVSRSISQALEKNMRPIKTEVYETSDFQPELIREAVVQYNQRVFESGPQSENEFSRPLMTQSKSAAQAKGPWGSLGIIGQYANTYIVAQSPKALVLVDQHAAHERVLFERLKKNFDQGNSPEQQTALMAELIELPQDAVQAITEGPIEKVFSQLGFEISRRGATSIGVSARPAFLIDVALTPLFERLSEQVLDYGSKGALDDLLGDMWASMSCHGAIRAGRVLSHEEMHALLHQMDEFSFSSFCPHGRPVSVHLSLYDLEKMFKRIV